MKNTIVLLLLALVPALSAASVEEARKAFEAGSHAQALEWLNAHLEKKPQDAEARFLKGLALVMLERDPEAIQVFGDLVRDYPELPEPYNNLAVLYARAGQYDKARDALESALHTHPSYATAHENLGDVYSALANAAYNRAKVLDKGNTTLDTKLALVEQLIALREGGQAASMAASRPATESRPARTPAPRQAQTAPPPAPVITPSEPARSEAASAGQALRDAILADVEEWRRAWTQQDVDAYLGSYSPNFEPATGISRSAWEGQRRRRVDRPANIRVQVVNPTVTLRGPDVASVIFRQIYESDTYSDQVRKELELEKTSRGWLIRRETVID